MSAPAQVVTSQETEPRCPDCGCPDSYRQEGPCCEEEYDRYRGGPVLLVGPPLPIDDSEDVRYSVHRRGRVIMAGTAPSADEARRLAFGSCR